MIEASHFDSEYRNPRLARATWPTSRISSCRRPGACHVPRSTPTPSEMRDLAYSMIRVLDDDGDAVGPWDPEVDADALHRGLAGDGA